MPGCPTLTGAAFQLKQVKAAHTHAVGACVWARHVKHFKFTNSKRAHKINRQAELAGHMVKLVARGKALPVAGIPNSYIWASTSKRVTMSSVDVQESLAQLNIDFLDSSWTH